MCSPLWAGLLGLSLVAVSWAVLCCGRYVAWGSLQRWIGMNRRDTSPAATAARVDIARGIVSGMAFLHSHGYIHCDLKPANVLLAFDGARFVAKVR